MNRFTYSRIILHSWFSTYLGLSSSTNFQRFVKELGVWVSYKAFGDNLKARDDSTSNARIVGYLAHFSSWQNESWNNFSSRGATHGCNTDNYTTRFQNPLLHYD